MSIIRVRNIGKRYRIGERERYLALRDILTRAATAPLRILARRNGSAHGTDGSSHIWALKDVSFDVQPGEVVGIVGSNGAGKTTLLKILARVTQPTEGFADVHGRMGSLLEVGTGFHPELTGRENTFLSGAILGMSKAEIRRKFDEIVAFAEVEKFIDTPVKHYSVGMRMRLAFAVAAHLEPEILLVDEVLSVGDVQFQKKCLGKMGKVAEGGRTILFVSHQMNQIRRLCERVLWIDGGGLRSDGPAKLVVNQYEAASLTSAEGFAARSQLPVVFGPWAVKPRGDNILDLDRPSTELRIEFRARVYSPIRNGRYGITLRNSDNTVVWSMLRPDLKLEEGAVTFVHEFPYLPLLPGIYSWAIGIYDGHRWLEFMPLPELSIVSANDSAVGGDHRGILSLPCELTIYTEPQEVVLEQGSGEGSEATADLLADSE
jgi:lipopolysaccharide transport system ATP-binding protein